MGFHRKQPLIWAALGLVLAAHLAANAVWVSQDQTLRSFDMGPYLFCMAQMYDLVREAGAEALWWMLRSAEGAIWTGGVFLPWLALSALFGHSVEAFRLFNLFYMAVLLGAMYLLGRQLHSPRAGLLAAVLVSLYPLVYGEGRQLGADFPGMAMTALAVALLACTDRFSRTGRSLLFGLVVGAAVMVKPQSAFFVAAPSALVLLSALVHPAQIGRRRPLLNTALAVAAALAVSSVWWLGRLSSILGLLVWHAKATETIAPGVEPSALFYLRTMPAAVTPFLLLVLAAALQGLVLSRRWRGLSWDWLYNPRLALVWAWLAGGFLFLSITRVRYMRYMLPLIPTLAVVTAVGLLSIRHRNARRVVVTLVLAAASCTWLVDSFVHNAAIHWGYEDDPTSTAPRSHYITSGPPAVSSLYTASLAISDFIGQRHPTGRGLLLMFKYPSTKDCELCDRFFWAARPLVAARLPGIHFREPLWEVVGTEFKPIPFVLQCDELKEGPSYFQVGRAMIPMLAKRYRQAYILKVEEGHTTVTDPPPPAKLVHEQVISDPLGKGGRTRLSLWHRRLCR